MSVGKEGRIRIGQWGCRGSIRYWDYLEDHWPYAGGLSAVNAIDS